MKHSNRYYFIGIKKTSEGKSEPEYTEVNAKRYKNNYGLDLFTFSDKYGVNISEGKTGMKIYAGIPNNFDEVINKFGGIEKFNQTIEDNIKKYGLTPRYTEPENMKEKPDKKEKDANQAFSKYLYGKGKAYFTRFYNENNIELYRKKTDTDDNYYTIYTPCNGWMIPLGSNGKIEFILEKLNDKEFSVHNWLVEAFEEQITDVEKWADLGIAEYLNRADEAKEHNAPIKAQREAVKKEEQLIKETKRKALITKKQKEYETAINNAENNIRNKLAVKNSTVTTYKSEFSCTEKSLILTLFKKHNIDVPLKTQGWVNNALVEIFFEESGEVSYCYFNSSKDSTVFSNYLSQLIDAITSNMTTEHEGN